MSTKIANPVFVAKLVKDQEGAQRRTTSKESPEYRIKCFQNEDETHDKKEVIENMLFWRT